jgi:hypothetical protein
VIELTDLQLRGFQEAFAWETAMRLPDGRVLGTPGKRGAVSEPGDFRVRAVAERLSSADRAVLELGCHEGIHTVQLAAVARRVTALDVRPKNIVGALTRVFVVGSDNVQLLLEDVRELDASFERHDILFHVGVLYHLADPVEHLYKVASLADDLLLDTHYVGDPGSRERSDLIHDGKRYVAYLYNEAGWADTFSGVEDVSRWLDRESLLRLVRDVGFDDVEVLDDRTERNGSRITLLGRKPGGRPRD